MAAQTLNCPMCGASVASDAPQCRFCEARLATVACPSCFAMMFIGNKHCARCGAAAESSSISTSADHKCPRCRKKMQSKSLGGQTILECPDCLGIWLDATSFQRICADREKQSAVLGTASLLSEAWQEEKVRYVPCPECSQLMNRANFARCSGVIIDLCKNHGIWFDRDELSRIIEFIREGGLEIARAKEKTQLAEERRRLEQLISQTNQSQLSGFRDIERSVSGIVAAGGLLDFFPD